MRPLVTLDLHSKKLTHRGGRIWTSNIGLLAFSVRSRSKHAEIVQADSSWRLIRSRIRDCGTCRMIKDTDSTHAGILHAVLNSWMKSCLSSVPSAEDRKNWIMMTSTSHVIWRHIRSIFNECVARTCLKSGMIDLKYWTEVILRRSSEKNMWKSSHNKTGWNSLQTNKIS